MNKKFIIKFFKRKIIYFSICLLFGICLFHNYSSSVARENAYMSCLIDDEACMYKTQVLWSGEEIELNRINSFCNLDLNVKDRTDGIEVYKYSLNYTSDGALNLGISSITGKIDNDTGIIALEVQLDGQTEKISGQEIPAEEWNKIASTKTVLSGGKPQTVLTFPASDKSNANENDINRAYSLSNKLGDDFRDALLFINDGKSYTSVETLIDSAYALVTANYGTGLDKGIIVNQFGNKYRVRELSASADGGYSYQYEIIAMGNTPSSQVKSRNFTYMIKKGYIDSSSEDFFEDGTKNNLNFSKANPDYDTEYITWEHLFLEAGILYAQGISYSNQADLYSIDAFENSLVKVTRSFLNGIKNQLQLFGTEDCIFNNSIRGSQAFTYGIYKTELNDGIFRFYMVMLSIALSLVVIAVIRIIIKREWATVSPQARYSIIEGLKDVIIVLFILSVLWLLMKLVFYINFEFVKIWSTYLGNKTMSQNAGYNSLSAILYAFIFFVIQTYINILYILRGLIVPLLMIIAPICVFVYCMGDKTKGVTEAWFKELLGNVFIQSFHALVYGFILINSTGLRGIESLVVCGSIIPLTSIIKDITGVGGGQLMQKAKSLAGGTVAAVGTATGAVGGAVGGAVAGIGGAVSNVGGAAGKAAGAFARSAGGVSKLVGGAGNLGTGVANMAVLDKEGQNISMGANQMASGFSDIPGNAISGGLKGASAVGSARKEYRENKAYKANSKELDTRMGKTSMGSPTKITDNGNGTKTATYDKVSGRDVEKAKFMYGADSNEYKQMKNRLDFQDSIKGMTAENKKGLERYNGAHITNNKDTFEVTYREPVGKQTFADNIASQIIDYGKQNAADNARQKINSAPTNRPNNKRRANGA